ncbi:D-alanyl-D-alanine carboxypeptidase/D-alanyl-D-alanine endopeptidase [Arcicella rigui]|uniref:D-alanyl-D-alanine carboxypeptidase/D-alanyl-D-alanine-endopeptidase n=1 Tax=Arcicella rigui TaxID=797020 RepID=A0ABU5Q8W5_9BACT|nr:D-alanyl-D-alanine carboxypeptidase/D-alanyl-D-alanine-endopeptidase [Arcicella rigui]MEA5139274.1 D-alanyl-D-alanine carboxypeptidase/D-alanyl-D-alanine-endopeptidase [Arcicella rigui]
MILFLLTFLHFLTFPATTDSLERKSSQEKLQKQIEILANSPFMQNGMVGVSIKAVKSNKTLIEYNANKSLAPASTLKLISSATALATLGEDYTYSTKIEYSGQITDSVLIGNIIIKGSGDPSLGSWRLKNSLSYKELFESWAKKIKSLGIKEIRGRVFGDGSLFDENVLPDTWIWSDVGNYFGAGAYGLNIHENLFHAVFRPGKYLEAATLVKTVPDLPYYQKINRVLTDKAHTGDQVNIYSTPYQEFLVMQGYVPAGDTFSVKGSIPDPPLLAAYILSQKIEDLGIKITELPLSSLEINKRKMGIMNGNPTMNILTHYSPPLKELAAYCNFNSINLYAESFLKTFSVNARFGNTTHEAVKGLKQIWMGKGLNLKGFNIKDGSGLSPSNGITAANMTEILTAMYSEKSFNAFYESIPIVGVSGTVAHLGKKSNAVGNVRAKSGSIEGVRAYAGYFTAKNGELMCFSFMLNKYNSEYSSATKELEKLIILMTEM